VNKILIGNKSDWTDKKVVTEEQGRTLASELGIRFMETSAKINEGVEEAFFTLARSVCAAEIMFSTHAPSDVSRRDIKTRLIDSQADTATAQGSTGHEGSVKFNQPSSAASTSCCS
jgi:Ras-related protein Rab-8A